MPKKTAAAPTVCPRCQQSDRIVQALHGPFCDRCMGYFSYLQQDAPAAPTPTQTKPAKQPRGRKETL
jgi:hypothetical protein